MTASSETTHRATQENGPSVVDGKLLWTSATGITTADPHSFGGCPRKWYYDQIEGRKAPPTQAMLAGTSLHAEIENHLLKGAALTSPLALAGRPFIPHPGSGLYIERPIHFTTRDGVHIYGHVDLYNMRQQYIDPDGVLQQDPPWSFEVKDWKTTSDFQYAKTERELAENIQLNTYAEAGFRQWPDLEHARLTHVYFRTRGRPESKLVTVRRSRDEIAMRWDYAESVVRCMSDVAKEQTAERVPANTKSCDAYRGCPHSGICSAYGRTSLDNLYSKIATDHVKENEVGILANNPQLLQNAPAAAPQPDMRAQLAAEEAAQRQQQALLQQQTAPQQAIAQACQRIMSHQRGFPAIAGNAAVAYAPTIGATQPMPPGYVFRGQGNLGAVTLTEVAHFFQLADELDAQAQQSAAPPAAASQTPSPPAAPPQQAGTNFSILPPDAPASQPQLAQERPPPQSPEQIVAQGEAPADPPKKTRGRPKKTDSAPAPEATAAVAAPTSPPSSGAPASQVPPATAATYTDPRLNFECAILINARFANVATKSLASYVDYINTELSKRYCVDNQGKPTLQDVRCAPKDSPLAYGGWKGAVRQVVKADPPPAGAYHLDTFMDDLNEAVADALRAVAEERGWMFVRGVR